MSLVRSPTNALLEFGPNTAGVVLKKRHQNISDCSQMSNCTVSLEFNEQAYLPADANVEILPRQSQIRCQNITRANSYHRSNVEMLDFDFKSLKALQIQVQSLPKATAIYIACHLFSFTNFLCKVGTKN